MLHSLLLSSSCFFFHIFFFCIYFILLFFSSFASLSFYLPSFFSLSSPLLSPLPHHLCLLPLLIVRVLKCWNSWSQYCQTQQKRSHPRVAECLNTDQHYPPCSSVSNTLSCINMKSVSENLKFTTFEFLFWDICGMLKVPYYTYFEIFLNLQWRSLSRLVIQNTL